MALRDILIDLAHARQRAADKAADSLSSLMVRAFGEDPSPTLIKLTEADTRELLAKGATKRIAPTLIRESEKAGGLAAARISGLDAGTLTNAQRRGFARLLEQGVRSGLARAALQVSDLLTRGRAEGRDAGSMREQLREDFAAQGPVTGTVTRSGVWSVETTGLSTLVSQQAIAATVTPIALPGDQWRWVAMGGNVCRVCEARHGGVAPYEEWRKMGLPGTSFGNPCRRRCRCTLLPLVLVDEELGPIVGL